MAYSNLVQDVADTQAQLGESDTLIPVFSLFKESLSIIDQLVIGNKQNIGHAFILGHAANGVLGVANGIDGSQITLGSGGLGASSLGIVHCPNKQYKEFLVTNQIVDTASTTATVNYSTQRIDF